jgi:hypothetical protein
LGGAAQSVRRLAQPVERVIAEAGGIGLGIDQLLCRLWMVVLNYLSRCTNTFSNASNFLAHPVNK